MQADHIFTLGRSINTQGRMHSVVQLDQLSQ